MKRLFTIVIMVVVTLAVTNVWAQSFSLSEDVEGAVIQGRWQKVFNTIKADSTKVDDPVSRMLMGHACLATQKNYGATKLFSTVEDEEDITQWYQYTMALSQKHPSNAIATYLFADAKLRQGNIDDAIAGFSKAIDQNNMLTIAYYLRGNAYEKGKKDFSNAIADYKSALQINPRFSRAYLNLGNIYHEKKQLKTAFKYYGDAVKVDSQFSQAYYNQGNILYEEGKYDSAILKYDKAIQLRPLWADAYYNRGNIYLFGKKQYVNAIFEYDKAININSSHVDALRNRGVAYVRNGDLGKALKDFNRVLQIKDDDAEAYSNRGNVYAQMKQYDKALNDYNRAIHFNSRLAEVYENRGVLYMMHYGDKEKACADWKKACKLGQCNNYNLAKQNGDCQ